MAFGDKVLNAMFQAVSGRTAGFTSVDFEAMEQHSEFFTGGPDVHWRGLRFHRGGH